MAHGAALYETRNHIGYVTINRPDRGNASNWQLCEDLDEIWAEIRRDEDVGGAIITGAGERHFCTGLDQREMGEAYGRGEDRAVRMASPPHDLWKPLIAAVNGVVAGGGFFFLSGSDFAICSENATFLEPHVSVGWIPVREMIGISTRMAFGPVMRMALMGTAERMDARRAYELGLVTEVVPLPRLIPRCTEVMEKILEQSTTAIRCTKEMLFRARMEMYALTQALEMGAALRELAHTAGDRREGSRAFAEHRKPQWAKPTGRWK
ncbi:MAG: enoyl-CoA hydratase/isomerase family protein [Chloroflexi bacterium]|nr:enoyl-CoA hydratase/isomerase family protein [Chloroflexota bacterium]